MKGEYIICPNLFHPQCNFVLTERITFTLMASTIKKDMIIFVYIIDGVYSRDQQVFFFISMQFVLTCKIWLIWNLRNRYMDALVGYVCVYLILSQRVLNLCENNNNAAKCVAPSNKFLTNPTYCLYSFVTTHLATSSHFIGKNLATS